MDDVLVAVTVGPGVTAAKLPPSVLRSNSYRVISLPLSFGGVQDRLMLERSNPMAARSLMRAGGPTTVTVKDCVALIWSSSVAVTEILASPGPVGVIVTTPALDTVAVATPRFLDSTV